MTAEFQTRGCHIRLSSASASMLALHASKTQWWVRASNPSCSAWQWRH